MGNIRIVQNLLLQNYDIEKKSSLTDISENELSPIHYACINGHTKIVQLLLSRNCDYESETDVRCC